MSGFVVPPYPQDRLGTLRRLASSHPLGLLDLSIGTPNDGLPELVASALRQAIPGSSNGYPTSLGSEGLRDSIRAYLDRRFQITVPEDGVMACVGTKELVASLARMLSLRTPERRTVLFPAISYPTYAMGATLAGLRAVPVPVDTNWHMNLDAVSEEDANDALLLWTNEPSNPTGARMSNDALAQTVGWARRHGAVLAADECYAEFSDMDHEGTLGTTSDGEGVALTHGIEGVLAVHSLSKRSNAAGLRSGFVAGDTELITYLAAIRKHAGLMVPGPIQFASQVAWSDDEHVAVQRSRYQERRAVVIDQLRSHGLVHDGGPHTFYLWLRSEDGADDGWEIAAQFAQAGILVAPGDLYGPAGADHVRLALVAEIDELARIEERFTLGVS